MMEVDRRKEVPEEIHLEHNHGHHLVETTEEDSVLEDLVVLDASHNNLHTLPKQMEDMKEMKRLIVGHNAIRGFPPHLWKMTTIEELDLSHNMLTNFPKKIGDLDLLKETSEWEVGIGLLRENLKICYAHNNRLNEFPFQVDMCFKLHTSDISTFLLCDKENSVLSKKMEGDFAIVVIFCCCCYC